MFRCVKYHPEAIEKELEFVLNSRETFEDFIKNKNISGSTDIQRAARYLYLIKASYGAKATAYGMKSRDISNADSLYGVKERLSRVVIEHKSFDKLITQYNKEDTLFYCDPPYHKTKRIYDTGDFIFDESQHIKLRDMLSRIKGKFILSYNDDELIRELYKDFNIEAVKRNNNLAARYNTNKEFAELIIRNY